MVMLRVTYRNVIADEGNDGCFALPSRAYLLPADVESGLSVYRSKVEARNASLIAPRYGARAG